MRMDINHFPTNPNARSGLHNCRQTTVGNVQTSATSPELRELLIEFETVFTIYLLIKYVLVCLIDISINDTVISKYLIYPVLVTEDLPQQQVLETETNTS